MAFNSLSDVQAQAFANAPEIKMDVQLGINKKWDRTLSLQTYQEIVRSPEILQNYFLVIGSRVAVSFDHRLSEQLRDLRERRWMAPEEDAADRSIDFRDWYSQLGAPLDQQGAPLDLVTPDIPEAVPETETERRIAIEVAWSILGLIYHGPIGTLPPVPPRPAYLYGHMQFYGDTEPDDAN